MYKAVCTQPALGGEELLLIAIVSRAKLDLHHRDCRVRRSAEQFLSYARGDIDIYQFDELLEHLETGENRHDCKTKACRLVGRTE